MDTTYAQIKISAFSPGSLSDISYACGNEYVSSINELSAEKTIEFDAIFEELEESLSNERLVENKQGI